MKPAYLFVFFVLLAAAISAGWFFDRQSIPLLKNTLEIPDNIDYYLAGIKLKSYNQQGTPSYQMNAPYLEHFVREDISLIQQPDFRYFADKADWLISARQGRLLHQTKIYELEQQVAIKRNLANQSLRLSTEQMTFNPESKIVEIPVALRLIDNKLDLHAQSAVLDMHKQQYIFQRVNAIYHTEQNHEPS